MTNQQQLNPNAFTAFGTELKKSGIQKASFPLGQTVIKILTKDNWYKFKVHYSDKQKDGIGLGYFHCFDGSCCKDHGLADEQLAVPIAIYTGNMQQYGEPITFAYLPVKFNRYQDLINLEQCNGDILNYDILVNCTDATYQKLSFTAIHANQSYITANIQRLQQNINDFMQEWFNKIDKSIATKRFNEQTYMAAKVSASNIIQQAQFMPNNQMSQLPGYNAQPQLMNNIPPLPVNVTPQPVNMVPPNVTISQQPVNIASQPMQDVIPQSAQAVNTTPSEQPPIEEITVDFSQMMIDQQ